MKIEFLERGSAGCPLIRIYGTDIDGCLRLKGAFEQLERGAVREIVLSDLPGIEPVSGCRVTAKAGKWDRGVLAVGEYAFDWVLTPSTWDNVAGLIEPFCLQAGGYQWLEQTSDTRVLISPSGYW
jgi:hypothetical protein